MSISPAGADVGESQLSPLTSTSQLPYTDAPVDTLPSSPESPYAMPRAVHVPTEKAASPDQRATSGLTPSPVPSSRLSGLLTSFDDLDYQ